MEQRNNKQDLIIFEIENLLNKMSNQVNFLIRKEMTMNQLDVDLLMENTRKLYDTICSVELGVRSEELGVRSEELGVDFDDNTDTDTDDNTDSELIDSSTDRLIDFVPVPVPEEEIEEIEEEELIPEENPIPEKEADMVWDFTIDNEESGVRSEELGVNDEEDADTDADSELIDSSTDRLIDFDADTELIDSSTDRLIDSDIDSDSDADTDTDADSKLIDSSTDGLIDSDEDKEEDSVPSPITNIYSAQTEEVSGIRTYKIVRENAPTISDKLEQSVDNSIAARMQRKPVSDLISAIDINDKFLFLNELFGGSMEKYNKSIRSLNSFSTLLGAKTYMSELQIEFQWDCNSDAYKKLADLVERRFI